MLNNVLLANPTLPKLETEPPLGLMYIASVLSKARYNVKIVEGDCLTIVKAVGDHRADIVGITCMTSMYEQVKTISSLLHAYDIPIIFGGVHATIMPETLLHAGYRDACIIGEGEDTILEYLDHYSLYDGDVSNVSGIAYIPESSTNITFTKKRPYIKDLDNIPFPARRLMNKKYLKHKRTTIIASRGCSFNCSFCQPTLRKLFGDIIRRRTPHNVLAEMRYCRVRYGIDHFEFFDDTFTSDKVWVKSFCALIAPEHFTWEALARVDTINYDLLHTMKDAGLTRLSLGFESGSQDILNTYCKGITVEQGRQALKWCADLRIKVHGYFMLGAIDETKESMTMTKDFIMQHTSELDTIFVTITTPTPCTRLYDQALRDKRLLVTWDKIDLLGSLFRLSAPKDYKHTVAMKLKHLTNDDVLKARYDILRSFYVKKARHPLYLINFIHNKSLSYVWNAAVTILRGE